MKPDDIVDQEGLKEKEELVIGHVGQLNNTPFKPDDKWWAGVIPHKIDVPPPMTREEAQEALKQVSKNLKDSCVVGSVDGMTFLQEKPKQAMRFDSNKLRLDLIPPEFLIELARVYTIGALKYDDDNWRKGMPWRKVYRPIWSHLIKWLSGHTIDSETGCHHLAMVAWNCATLFMYQLHKLGTDDRFKFDIDENFKWVDNHLNIGLDDAKITELKDKYKQQRENHK